MPEDFRLRPGAVRPGAVRRRGTAMVLALAILVAACSPTADPQPANSSVPPAGSDGARLTYELEYGFGAGASYVYELEVEQHVVLETVGSATAVLDEEVPASADVTILAKGRFVYAVEAGVESDTFEVTITGEFDDVSVEGTADGNAVDSIEDISQLGSFAPFSRTVVVDRRGRVVGEAPESGDLFGIGGTALAGFTGDLAQLPGPVLAESEVGIGEEWTASFEDASLGDDPVRTEVTAEVTGADTQDGREVVMITSRSTTGKAETDLAEFFASFFAAFSDGDDGESGAVDQIVFAIVTEPVAAESETTFDPERGLVLSATTSGPIIVSMDVALPDPDSDGLEEFTMSLKTDQRLIYRLTEADT